MRILKPGPEMWPKRYRNEYISDALYWLGWTGSGYVMDFYRYLSNRKSFANSRRLDKALISVINELLRVTHLFDHFGFRFREDRDEMVWYIEEERWMEEHGIEHTSIY